MENERLQILKMLQDNKISADEASRLLAALDEPQTTTAVTGGAKWIRVRVFDLDSGKAKVNVNLPITLIDVALNIGMKFIPPEAMGQASGVDIQQLMGAIKHGAVGKLVEVEDEDEGYRVEVIVE
jgi:hypothetical protein